MPRFFAVADVRWSTGALAGTAYLRAKQPRVAERIEKLLASIALTPFQGLGKPEPLKVTFQAGSPAA